MNQRESIYLEVKEFIESCDCSLITKLEEFINKSQPILISCSNCTDGKIKTRFNDFIKRKNNTCRECIKLQNRKIEFEKFTLYVEKESDCILLSDFDDFNNNTSKLRFKCACGEDFITTSSMFTHSDKRQCNQCGVKRRSLTQMITFDEVKQYIEEKGQELLTSKEDYINASQTIKIRCNCGEVFLNTFSLYKYGKGIKCNQCNIKDISERNTIPYVKIKEFVEIESESGCRLITSKDEYINTRLSIDFECNCGETFNTSFHEFKSGFKRQCNFCGNNLTRTTDFVKLFEDTYTANNCTLISFQEENGHVHSRSIVKLKCSCGEIFETQRYYFTNLGKNRCEKCSNAITKGEEEIRKFLRKNEFVFKWQYYINECRGKRKPLPFDFAILNTNGSLAYLVEYDGKQHFEPVNFGGCSDETALEEHKKLVENDSIKNTYCKTNNIPLIRIPYWDFDNIEEILQRKLIEYK